MEQEIEYRRQIVNRYRGQIEPLIKYIPWLTEHEGGRTSGIYDGEGIGANSVPIPVYDGTLMNFVREVQRTKLLDKNYVYVYSRYRMNSPEEEKRRIAKATIKEMDVLTGILSKYILGGVTKGYVWPQGVENGIYLHVILKMKEILEFWDKPIT